ncbi:MAG: M20/M25/M40 family metallo-hydrolase [bacterium]
MKNNKLLLDLIQINSESGKEKEIGEYIFNYLKQIGLKVEKQFVNKETGNFNVYAYVGKPKVIFSSHIDTVMTQLEVRSDTNKIYGRGACDNKSQIAAAILAAEQALAQNLTNFGLLFTVQEETDFSGAKQALSLLPKCELIVIGEPTNLDIVKGHNGILVLELVAKGKTAHGSVPEKGINAIELLMNDLNAIKNTNFVSDKILGKNILNIAKISGGIADNVVPDYATAVIAFRTVDKSSNILKQIKELAKSKINIIFNFEPVSNDIAENLAKKLNLKTKVVRYFTEASILKAKGKVIILGAGNIREAHSRNEYVLIREFNKLIDIYTNIIKFYF